MKFLYGFVISLLVINSYGAQPITGTKWNDYPRGTPGSNDTFMFGTQITNKIVSYSSLVSNIATHIPAGTNIGTGTITNGVSTNTPNVVVSGPTIFIPTNYGSAALSRASTNAGSSYVILTNNSVDLSQPTKDILVNVAGAVVVNSLIQPRIVVVGHSINAQLYTSPDVAGLTNLYPNVPALTNAQWSTPGGYSNNVADLWTNGVGYYHNGSSYYASNNADIWIYLTNIFATTKGFTGLILDQANTIPGSTSGFQTQGYQAGQVTYQDQDIVGSGASYNGSGLKTNLFWVGFTNALCFGSTNDIYVTIAGINYTNPYYLGITSGYASPTNLQYVPIYGQYYTNQICHGIASTLVKVYGFSRYIAGATLGKFAPPYNPSGGDTHALVYSDPLNYIITNGPAYTGTNESGIYFSVQNEWSQGVITYFPHPDWTNWQAGWQFYVISNACAQMVAAGIQPMYLVTEPLSPSIISSPTRANGILTVNQLIRSAPINGVTVLDLAATNIPYQSTASLYIDGTHYASPLQLIDATAISIATHIPSSATRDAIILKTNIALGTYISGSNGALASWMLGVTVNGLLVTNQIPASGVVPTSTTNIAQMSQFATSPWFVGTNSVGTGLVLSNRFGVALTVLTNGSVVILGDLQVANIVNNGTFSSDGGLVTTDGGGNVMAIGFTGDGSGVTNISAIMTSFRAAYTTNYDGNGVTLDASIPITIYRTNASYTVLGFNSVLPSYIHQFANIVTNYGASSITVTMPTSGHPFGTLSTNVVTIPAGGMAHFNYEIHLGSFTNYNNYVIQPYTNSASAIGFGTLADARLSGNIPLLTSFNTFSNNISGTNAGGATGWTLFTNGNFFFSGGGTIAGTVAFSTVPNIGGAAIVARNGSGTVGNLTSWATTGNVQDSGISTNSLLKVTNGIATTLTITNGPILGLTNIAPAGLLIGTTIPVRWFPITNSGVVYLVPGYAP